LTILLNRLDRDRLVLFEAKFYAKLDETLGYSVS